jgi:CBS domain-containing membrane protein/CBS domain-containing protein
VKVKELMRTRNLLSVRPDDDIALAGQIMAWGGCRHLPVLEDRRVVGLITERDVLRYRVETGGTGGLDPVRLFMTKEVATIGPEDDVLQAAALIVGKRIGCLPVVDEGQLVGILTTTDIVASHVVAGPTVGSGRNGKLLARDAMKRDVATVPVFGPLLEAVGLMVDRGIRHVTVVDDQRRVVGIVSDRDVRTALGDPLEALRSELEELEAMKISGVMTTPVLTVQDDAPLEDVARRFVDERIGAIPVVDRDDRLTGIISYVDVIGTLQRALTV